MTADFILPGTFVGLVAFTLLLFLVYGRRLLGDQAKSLQRQGREVRFLRGDSRWCNDRLSKLIFVCRSEGITVPDEMLERPDWLTELELAISDD